MKFLFNIFLNFSKKNIIGIITQGLHNYAIKISIVFVIVVSRNHFLYIERDQLHNNGSYDPMIKLTHKKIDWIIKETRVLR
jgi:hypothetical protein